LYKLLSNKPFHNLLRNIEILIATIDSVNMVEKSCFWKIFYHEVALKTLQITWTVQLDCSPLISFLSRTDAWQILYIAGHSVSCRSKVTYPNGWLSLNVLPYLASLLWTACEGATLSIQYLKTYTGWAYKPLVFFLLIERCLFSVSSSGSFIPEACYIVSCLDSVSYWCVWTVVTWPRLFVNLTSELPFFFSNMLNSSVDTLFKHPTYPSASRSIV
jgi:hypothetical protein